METYKINFTNDRVQTELVKKWNGKEINLIELEEVIDELGLIVFDGDQIEVYNDYRE